MPALDAAAVLAGGRTATASPWRTRADPPRTRGFARAEAECLPVGARDAALLHLRRRLFGDRIDAITMCASCGQELDVILSVSALLREWKGSGTDVLIPSAEGVPLQFRIPNAGDLAALHDVDDVESGVALLIERCMTFANDGADHPRVTLSADVEAALEEALVAADPGAELLLASDCPACGSETQALFDIPSFLWRETAALAQEILWDVHELASAYGWSEDAMVTPSSRSAQILPRRPRTMSGFLHRLVARTLGSANVARPRPGLPFSRTPGKEPAVESFSEDGGNEAPSREFAHAGV